jgi:hypothetical protein
MNQRILELARQVWPDPNISHVNHMKFAQLIVEECANVADENYIHRGSRTCGLAIRLHFGVEE